MRKQSIKSDLEAYRGAGLELMLLTAELRRYHMVRDSVKGSMDEFPYTQQTISIAGISPRVARKLSVQKSSMEALRNRVEKFLATVDDPYMASLLRLRYVNGLKWEQVAARAGGGNAESTVKNAVHKFLNSENVATKATK